MLLGLDTGELQVLLLAQEVHADWVIIDERLGRRIARVMNLPVKGTVGIACSLSGWQVSKTQARLSSSAVESTGNSYQFSGCSLV